MAHNNTSPIHLWLIRLYAVIIIIVVAVDFFEGAALTIVLIISAIAIIAQSFFMTGRAGGREPKQDIPQQ